MSLHDEHILLCDGCAAEAGMNDAEHAIPPGDIHADAACQRCGAILVGFAYRVPADVYTGMAPGAG
jgi:hypothetical protein